MSESQPNTRGSRGIEILRWIAIVPAAVIAGWLFAGVFGFLLSRIGIDLRGSAYPAFLFPLLQLLPSGLAFTVAGALIAPRSRVIVAIVLAIVCISLSILRHIVGQSSPGLTNYMHVSGELLGAVIGVLYLAVRSRKAEVANE